MFEVQTRCERSYPLVHPELVAASLVTRQERESSCVAEMREISASSAKLLVQGPPELPWACSLRLVSSKLPRTLEIPSEIGWARPNPAGDWLVECEFEQRMSEKEFAQVVNSGILERRSSVRVQTRIPVQVVWPEDDDRKLGIVRDLSEGGLCLMTCRPPRSSREVFVIAHTPQGEAHLPLKIRWSLSLGRNQLIGCQFTRGEDFYLLRKLQPAANTSRLHEHGRNNRPSCN